MKKITFILFCCVLALLLVTVSAAAIRAWDGNGRLQIELTGEQEIYLEYGNEFTDPGAVGSLKSGKKITTVPVETESDVDTDKVGVYPIKYTARSGDRIATFYRYVHVVDKEAPVIQLLENPNSFTLTNEKYVEEGFYAEDDYDGDLTDKVIRHESGGKVTYTVSDTYGNTTTVTRTIRYLDPNIPEIAFEGGQMTFIRAGENFVEPGYTATDLVDGDVTTRVEVTGAVDNLTSGIYNLEYKVTNSRGLTANRTRTVYVIPQQNSGEEDENTDGEGSGLDIDIPTGGTAIEPNGKTIYLTFDDGPSEHTARLLDVLNKYGVKATFFVVSGSHHDMITRAYQEGHSIAIHAYEHRYSKIYASDEAFYEDLEAMQNLILELTGEKTMLTRFPGGSSNTVSSAYNKGIMTRLTQSIREKGYQYFDWNVDSNDAGGAQTADEVFENVIKGVQKRTNSIVLQHDTRGFSVDAVERIIAWGLCNGYTFRALDINSPASHHGVNN